MDELDRALTEWGRDWRSRQASVPPLAGLLPNRRPARPRWSPTPILVAVTVFGLVWIGVQAADQDVNSGVGSLRPGAAVEASGSLIQEQTGRVLVCTERGGRLPDPAPPPTCSVVAVAVDGIDFKVVPGAAKADGFWFARGVTVTGTWNGHSIDAQSVGPAVEVPGAPSNPCAPNEGDGTGLLTPTEEAALRELGAEVFGKPDRYAGLWRAGSSDGLGRVVVGVIGDSEAAEPVLRRLYPYPLCVITVEFSEAQLNETLDAIGRSTDEWLAHIDFPVNRVTVSVGVLTEEARARLQPHWERVMVRELPQSR